MKPPRMLATILAASPILLAFAPLLQSLYLVAKGQAYISHEQAALWPSRIGRKKGVLVNTQVARASACNCSRSDKCGRSVFDGLRSEVGQELLLASASAQTGFLPKLTGGIIDLGSLVASLFIAWWFMVILNV